MAFETITTEEIAVGKPVTNSLQTKIKNSLDDLNLRVNAVAGSSIVQVFNTVFRMPEIQVGSAIWTWDTQANLQATGLGSNWVRAGGSGEGTWDDGAASNHNVPDARNQFLRMGTTYAAVNVTDLVADSFKAHTHTETRLNEGNGYELGSGDIRLLEETVATGSTGGTETAPKHIIQDLVFKKAYTYGETRLIYRAASSFTINNTVLTQLEAGSAGNLEIDIEVGNLSQMAGDTMTSIFTTKPTLASGDGDFSEDTGTINVSNAEVATNDYIVMTITGLQTGMAEFFIQVTGA